MDFDSSVRVRTVWQSIALALGAVLVAACTGGSSSSRPDDVQMIGPFAPDAGVITDGAQPDFGTTHSATSPPPAISGGTLLVTHDDTTAVASDPDLDIVWLVNVATRAVTAHVALSQGDEPGRAVEGANGRVHIALRRGGAIATIDTSSGTLVTRRAVCAAPRGIAYDATHGALVVACAGGELVTLPEAGGAATSTLHLDRDLRDVFIDPATGHVAVTQFRRATLDNLDTTGAVTSSMTPPAHATSTDPTAFTPGVAWRTVSLGAGSFAMLYELESSEPVQTVTGGYAPGIEAAIVKTGVMISSSMGMQNVMVLAPLAVDIAANPTTHTLTVVAAGNALNGQDNVFTFDPSTSSDGALAAALTRHVDGQAVAVAFTSTGVMIVQTREPAALYIDGPTATPLGDAGPSDTGHEVFHNATAGGLTCAGCHPEGGDDGHLWNFADMPGGTPVQRRTQSLRGGLMATAPFHWDGRFVDLGSLLADVYSHRMLGPALATDQVAAVGTWLDALPTIPLSPPADPASVARGQTLFQDPTVGCTACHNGAHFTNNQSMDVGTGGAFQVPTLIGVAWRAPFLHNGCAATLTHRFDPACGGGDSHGHTSQLAPADIADLVAYLQQL